MFCSNIVYQVGEKNHIIRRTFSYKYQSLMLNYICIVEKVSQYRYIFKGIFHHFSSQAIEKILSKPPFFFPSHWNDLSREKRGVHTWAKKGEGAGSSSQSNPPSPPNLVRGFIIKKEGPARPTKGIYHCFFLPSFCIKIIASPFSPLPTYYKRSLKKLIVVPIFLNYQIKSNHFFLLFSIVAESTLRNLHSKIFVENMKLSQEMDIYEMKTLQLWEFKHFSLCLLRDERKLYFLILYMFVMQCYQVANENLHLKW